MNQDLYESLSKKAAQLMPKDRLNPYDYSLYMKILAELIVREMCGLMEQAEDDYYHCFDASERPTEYIEWLRDWQERFEKHFGVDE